MAAPTAANWDFTTVEKALKEWYSDSGLTNACYTENKLCLLNPNKLNLKKTKVEGLKFIKAVQYAASGGLGMSITTANADAKEAEILRWEAAPKTIIKKDNLDTTLMYASTSDRGSFLKATVDIIKNARVDLAVEIERRLFGSGTGAVGVVGSVNGLVITLATASDARNFEVGMSVQDTGANITQVTAVNRGAGTVTVAATTGLTVAGTIIYRYGFYQATAANGVQGLAAHFPTVRTGSTTVQGIDVSVDWDRLAGTHVDASGATPYEAVIDGVMQAKANGADPTHIVMSFEDLSSLITDAQGQRLFQTDTATVGFKTAVIAVPDGGLVSVVGSVFCPSSTIYALNRDDLEIIHWTKDLMDPQNQDGSILHYNDASMAWNVRHLALFDLLVNTPVKHAVITI